MAKGQAVSLTIPKILAFVCVLLCIGSAHVQAESNLPTLLITEVQTQSISSKTEEYIEIYNPSQESVNVSQLQVQYLTASGNITLLSLNPSLENTALQAHGYLLLSQDGYDLGSDATFYSGLSDLGGHIQLVLDGEVTDTVGWGTATLSETAPALVATKGSSISRITDEVGIYQDTNNNQNDFIESQPNPQGGGILEELPDVCPNIEGAQAVVPAGYELGPDLDCELSHSCELQVTEISAQPNSDGQEYVELMNPSTQNTWPALCVLRINGSSPKSLPDSALLPGARIVALFASGNIRNFTGEVSLTSSIGQTISYIYPTTISGQTVNFSDTSITGYVSDRPTPGAVNQDVILSEEELTSQGDAVLALCPEGKYRNPLTNRCKNVEATVAVLASCDEGQERNPQTNRCRKITTAVATLVPCKAGQERNPETNRCRSITSADSTLKPCDEGQERNPDTNRCRKIVASSSGSSPALSTAEASLASPLRFGFKIVGALLTAVLMYGIYEYRIDIRNLFQKVRQGRIKGRPPD